jgi:hypothetical protein
MVTSLVAVYIGPCDVLIALLEIESIIKKIGTASGVNWNYITGLVYNKSTVMVTTRTGDVIPMKDERGVNVMAMDPQKKTILFAFNNNKITNLLLGKNEDGSNKTEELDDPMWLSYAAKDDGNATIAAILGVNPSDLFPPMWSEIEVTEAKPKKIVINSTSPTIAIPMSRDVSMSRSIMDDADYGTGIFHTKFAARSTFGIEAGNELAKVRVKNAFTYPIYPEEINITPVNYVAANQDEIVRTMQRYNGGAMPKYEVQKGGDIIFSMFDNDAAVLALNLKGKNINVGSIKSYVKPVYKPSTSSPDRRYGAGQSSSKSSSYFSPGKKTAAPSRR